MRKLFEFAAILLVALLIGQPVVAFAASSARLVPSGQVSVLDNGKEVDQFHSEMPLPQGILMACNGSCVVQIQNIQLVAQDKAVFALADDDARWDLTAKSGRIDFAFRSNAKLVSFRTPHDVIQTERIVVSASSEGMVRGYLNVTADKTELTVEQGALQVSTRNGTQTIEPGKSIVLAQAQVPPPVTDKKKVGADLPAGGGGGGGGGLSTAAWVGIGVGAAGIAAGAAVLATSGGGNPVSPE